MSLMAAGIAVIAVGTVVNAFGQIQQGKAQQKWGSYNAAVAERDAETARLNAEYEAGVQRKETQKLLGRQRALYGKSGVTLEGSPLLLMAETAAEGELDALMIERGGKMRAQGYRSEATLSRMKGSAAKRAGYYGAGSTLLTGAGQAAYQYGAYRKKDAKKG